MRMWFRSALTHKVSRSTSQNVPKRLSLFAAILVLHGLEEASPAHAQYYVNGSTGWSSSWGFGGSVQRSIDNQQADLIAKKSGGFYDAFGPGNSYITYNTTTDNRSNYVELNGDQNGQLDVSNKIGDDIGKNTNVIGAMNTGNTEIGIDGNNNNITAINSADSVGCLDGSINIARSNGNLGRSPSALAGVLSGLNGDVNGGAFGDRISSTSNLSAGSTQSGCRSSD